MTHDASNEWVTTSTVLQGLSDFDSHGLFRIVWPRIDHARRIGDQRAANVSMQPAETGAWMQIEAPAWTSPEWEEVWELALTRNATSIAKQRFSDRLRELIEPCDERERLCVRANDMQEECAVRGHIRHGDARSDNDRVEATPCKIWTDRH